MNLVERHIISKNHKQFRQIDCVCFLSKNLYNAGLYTIKQHFLETGKWIRYNQLEKLFKTTNQIDYRSLSIASSQQILRLLDTNLKSYFRAIKSWKRDNKKFTGCPKFPKYKDSVKGRNIMIYDAGQLSKLHDHKLVFPKKDRIQPINIKCPKEDIRQVRIIPQSSCYVIEIVYNFNETVKEINNEYLAVDLGVNNLAAVVNTKNNDHLLINGKPLKSINQYYNKKLAKLKSNLTKNNKKHTSNNIQKLSLKRNNKINYYLHHASKQIINYCIDNEIDNIVIGENINWKQNVNIGKQNNQNFVQIPFDKFKNQIKYKSQKVGIKCTTINEAYTSMCSALDLELISKQDIYLGNRIERGIFQTNDGILINADINGALNILRKEIKRDEFIHRLNRGFVTNPLKINLHKK